MKDYEKSLFVSDLHIPYHDVEAVRIMLNFSKWFKPNQIFILGDLIDAYALSRFDKDPKRKNKLQLELNEAVVFLADLRHANPRAVITLTEGNHEDRLRKYLWSKAEELADLDSLQLESLLMLDKFKINLVKYRDTMNYHGVLLEHGDMVRKFSAYTAKGMREKRGASGLSGHTHRMGSTFHRDFGGDFVWYETGCLCDRNPEYCKLPDWQNSMSVGYFKKNEKRFIVDQIWIGGEEGEAKKAVYAGREFTP